MTITISKPSTTGPAQRPDRCDACQTATDSSAFCDRCAEALLGAGPACALPAAGSSLRLRDTLEDDR